MEHLTGHKFGLSLYFMYCWVTDITWQGAATKWWRGVGQILNSINTNTGYHVIVLLCSQLLCMVQDIKQEMIIISNFLFTIRFIRLSILIAPVCKMFLASKNILFMYGHWVRWGNNALKLSSLTNTITVGFKDKSLHYVWISQAEWVCEWNLIFF